MGYQEFISKLKEEVEILFGKEYQVITQTILKENDQNKEAIAILKKEDAHQAVPVIYMKSYYELYCNGAEIKACALKIKEDYDNCQKSSREAELLKDKITDWEAVRENIYPILLSEKENQELLQTLVSRRMLDLRICYIIREKEEAWEHGRIKITKEMAKPWGITEELLFHQAMENLRNDSYKITGLEEMVMELTGVSDEESYLLEKSDDESHVKENADGIYVFTNKEKIYGAAGILIGASYFRKAFGERDLYIIPSSIHETLLVPYSNQWTVNQLNAMVREVNQEQVLPEERLADHIYFYDCEKGTIRAL